MSTPLEQLQNQFYNYIFYQDTRILEEVESPLTLSDASVGMDIYRNGYYERLSEVIKNDYKVFSCLLGSARIEELVRDYAEKHPVSTPYLFNWSWPVLDFIEQKDIPPWAMEMAVWEKAMSEIWFTSTQGALLTEKALVDFMPEDWPHLWFQLQPALCTFSFHYSIPRVWEKMMSDLSYRSHLYHLSDSDARPDLPYEASQDLGAMRAMVEELEASYSEKPTFFVLWRVGDSRPCYQSLSLEEMIVLKGFQKGHCFADVCSDLSDIMEDANIPLWFGSHLRYQLKQGWLASVTCNK